MRACDGYHLTEFRMGDVAVLLAWVRSPRQMAEWSADTFGWPLTQAQLRRHVLTGRDPASGRKCFGYYRGTKLIGYCDLSNISAKNQSAGIGRVIVAPRLRNRGIGKGMIGELVAYGFGTLGLHRIVLGLWSHQPAPHACYSAVGFTDEGMFRESMVFGKERWSCRIMGLLRREWERQAPHG